MFSESIRISAAKCLANKAQLNLKQIGRSFFEIANAGEMPEEITIILEGCKSTKLRHSLRSPSSGRASWIVKTAAIAEFYSETGLTQDDELIIRRASPTEYRISPLGKPFSFIDLFAGIGGIRLGLEAVSGQCVFSSEYDELAQQTYAANFGEIPSGDITEIHVDSIPKHDILAGGFPCQPFSIIGKRKGFSDTRGTLFFEIHRILEARRPYAILLENVKQFRTHDKGRTAETVMQSLQELGYHTHLTVLNALDFGVAQKRERAFIVAFQEDIEFSFPEGYGWYPSLDTVFEPEEQIDPKLIGSPYIQEKRLDRLAKQGREPFYPSMWHENKGGHIGMHPFSCALRHNASYNYLLVNGRRRASGREMLRLQGYPECFKIPVNHTAIRAQCGNSVAVPVITAIAARMALAMRLAIPKNTMQQHHLFV